MKPKFDNIYVLAPYNFATGGVELAHQLVDRINDKGGKAFIVYVDNGAIIKTDTVTPQYQKYNVNIISEIEDKDSNFLVVPETLFEWIGRFDKIPIGCWWMSVDNRYALKSSHWRDTIKYYPGTIRKKLSYVWHNYKNKVKNRNKLLKRENFRLWHFYQSVYAQNHLYKLGFSNVLPLGDYINTDFISDNKESKRENLILYNPAKGYKFTQKLIKANPDLSFIPLKGLSRSDLVELMNKAKIYIDFGHFPGKDRLARESVVNGLAVITGKKGASFYYEDVPLPEELKFDIKNKNIKNISLKIKEILHDSRKYESVFSNYKNIIFEEKQLFENQISKFFFV